jgi:hypothetical protein
VEQLAIAQMSSKLSAGTDYGIRSESSVTQGPVGPSEATQQPPRSRTSSPHVNDFDSTLQRLNISQPEDEETVHGTTDHTATDNLQNEGEVQPESHQNVAQAGAKGQTARAPAVEVDNVYIPQYDEKGMPKTLLDWRRMGPDKHGTAR